MTEQIERLAHHALRGEVWEKAVTCCQQAGEKAMARSVYRQAMGYFEQALSVLARLPETRTTREQAIDLRLVLHNALLPSGDFGRILAYLREAESLAESLADPRRLGQVSRFLSLSFYYQGAYDQAITAGARALTLAMASGDAVLQALANQYLGLAYEAQGDCRRAIDYLRQTVGPLDGVRPHEHGWQLILPPVISRALLVRCHAELGMFPEGSALGDEVLRIAEAVDHPGSFMYASAEVGLLFLRQGALPRALPLLERAMAICQDADFPLWFPRMAAALGTAYALSGRIADAVPLLTRAMAQATAMARGHSRRLGRLLGEVQLLAGCLDEAHALAERSLALTRVHQERGNEAYALGLLGEIATQREPPEVELAEAYYQQSLALAEELGMRPLQAHCHRGLGMLYAMTGQRELARTELSTAIAMYRDMDMTFWLPQTEAVLTQVEGR
jgi:tetratricopeptide (TPR) repeat protein